MHAAPGPVPVVQLRAVARRYGTVPVLRGIDLEVAAGECVALFGANGAGKSTLLRTLAGLLRADSGEALVLGRALPGDGELRRRVGYLGHETFLYRDLDARENLGFHARLFGVRDAARVDALLADVGLSRVAARRVSTYSRGMLQRLALARVLLHRPALLLLDEPLTGLDPDGADLLARLLAAAVADGAAVLMATHDVGRALQCATRAVVLARGRVAWDSGDAPLAADDVAARYAEAGAAA